MSSQIFFTTIAPTPVSTRTVTPTATPTLRSTPSPTLKTKPVLLSIPTNTMTPTATQTISPTQPLIPTQTGVIAPPNHLPASTTTMTTSKLQDPVSSQSTLSIIGIILIFILCIVEWSTIKSWLNQGGSWRDINNTV